MTTYTATIAGSAIQNGTKTFTVSDADYQNILNYLIFKYTPRHGGAPPTPGQALIAWQNDIVRTLVAETKRWMDDNQKAQVDTPPPVMA